MKIKEISIKDDVEFGSDVEIILPVNIYGCKISNNCFIGPFVEIQKTLQLEIILESSHIH